jgi:hypothetical protein
VLSVAAASLYLRVGIFAFSGILTLQIASWLLAWAGLLVQAVLAVFFAAVVANGVALRVFERGGLSWIGLAWKSSSLRHLGIGLAGGVASALAVTVLPVFLGLASYVAAPDRPFNWGSIAFVSLAMLFGAIGEELLFHGYAFQLMMSKFGAFATMLPVGVLFALAHENNLAANWMSGFNTFLWGVFLGLCFLRSGDLWLPIGVHFSWNWALAMTGAQVSGFQMSAVGARIEWHIPTLWSGGAYGPEAGLFCTLLLPVLGYALWKAPISTERPALFADADSAA